MHRGDALDAYSTWPTPTVIVSDGAYGLGRFPDDPTSVNGLVEWYAPHVAAWSRAAGPATTLWVWNTKIGWATLHPQLVETGWDHVQAVVWDKGPGHIAGRVNSTTIRRFPVVTEIAVLYRRHPTLATPAGPRPERDWLRDEWTRTGLPMSRADDACGVRRAASRKYLARDHQYYRAPGTMVERLARFANQHGAVSGRPYFSLDGHHPVTAAEWDAHRYPWQHAHGLTNVWCYHPSGTMVAGMVGRIPNQKPVELMARRVRAVTTVGDVVWEPFAAMATASVGLGCRPYAAETNPAVADLAETRLARAVSTHNDVSRPNGGTGETNQALP